jgi:predicted aspartyl protease
MVFGTLPKEFIMSAFREEITLENSTDATNAVNGLIKESEVRRLTVNAMVDSGAWTLVINEETRVRLGLEIRYMDTTEVANGKVETCGITTGVTVRWKDRDVILSAAVLPEETEVLLGAYPIEGMDLLIDCKHERLIGAHGDKPLRVIK